MAMLAALIFRGVAFEFRHKAQRSRPLWDIGFAAGSLVASFIQGTMVGALARGLPIENGAYVGGTFGWCSGFALLCGLGLCVGYTLLGASWLVVKAKGEVQQRAARLVPWLTAGVLVFLALAFAQALAEDFRIMQRWLERPYLFLFPAIGLVAALRLLRGMRRAHDAMPLAMTALIFAMAFGTLAVSFWPDMVPFNLSIGQAAAPRESLSFMFWGAGLFILPLVLIYNVIAYRVFAGKLPQYH
jgi:cytochrome d ubiquinol oxidase subunit II